MAILWIVSPFIVLGGLVLLNLAVAFAGINSPTISVITLVGGMMGIMLIFVGPIVGIVKLARNK